MKAYPRQTALDENDLIDLGLDAVSFEAIKYLLDKDDSETEIRAIPKYEEDSDDYCRIPSVGEWYLSRNKAFKITDIMGPIKENHIILRLAIVVPYTEYEEVEKL